MTDGLPSDVTNPQLTLVTLGTTALRAEANVALFDLGKPLALITYLSCAPDRAAAREHLIDLLWGDVGPDAAKHALRQTLWYIRKRLGDRPLIVGGDMLRIVAPIDFDRDRFLAAVADNSVENVVQLYTGDFFPGFAAPGGVEFERWADIERQRLRGFFWRAAETVVRRWMSTGRLRDAQALARRVRDSDPLREGGWRLLFETLIAGGEPFARRPRFRSSRKRVESACHSSPSSSGGSVSSRNCSTGGRRHAPELRLTSTCSPRPASGKPGSSRMCTRGFARRASARCSFGRR
jgi:DNA-binding SARP family transcriptional activator